MVDIIGIITEIASPIHFQSKRNIEMVRRNIKLCDQTSTLIDLTLWNKEAEDFSENNINSIIALKGATINHYTGISISCTTSTGITLNPKSLPEADHLLQWWQSEGQSAFQSDSFLSLSNSSLLPSQPLFLSSLNTLLTNNANNSNSNNTNSNNSNNTNNSNNSNNTNNNNLDTITFTLYGTISQFSIGRKMYYLGCSNPDCHFKGVRETEEGTYICPNCNEIISEPVPRYSFSFRLMDMTGSTYATVIGNDDIGKILLGRTAQEWYNEFHEKEENDILEGVKNYCFKLLKFKIRAKTDMYKGSFSPKLTVLNVEEPNYAEAAKLFISEIKKY